MQPRLPESLFFSSSKLPHLVSGPSERVTCVIPGLRWAIKSTAVVHLPALLRLIQGQIQSLTVSRAEDWNDDVMGLL